MKIDLSEWLRWVLRGERRELRWAQEAMAAEPEMFNEAAAAVHGWLACALGNVAGVKAALARDTDWAMRAVGPLGMSPLSCSCRRCRRWRRREAWPAYGRC